MKQRSEIDDWDSFGEWSCAAGRRTRIVGMLSVVCEGQKGAWLHTKPAGLKRVDPPSLHKASSVCSVQVWRVGHFLSAHRC